VREWDRRRIYTILAAVLLAIVGHLGCKLRIVSVEVIHQLHVLLFLGGGQASHLAVTFVKDLLEMALGLQVEVLHALRVVHALRVDFLVADKDSFPNLFFCLLQIYVQELVIFDVPEGVVDFDSFYQLAVENWLALALDLHLERLRFDNDEQVARLSALWQCDLDINIHNLLSPAIF